MRYSAYCLCEPKEHLSACLNASLSETMQTKPTNKALLPTVGPSSHYMKKKNNTVKPCALLFFHSLDLNLWMLGLTRLALSSCCPYTEMSGEECRPVPCRAMGHKGQEK